MPKARVNGINIAYDVDGHGEPLILVMGLGGSRKGWIFQKPSFRKHFKVITFDSRGVGDSDKPDEAYTIKTLADDVIGLMDHLGIDRAHVLGVSHGGRVAQEVAISYPERVSRLVLASTTTGGEEELTPEMREVFNVEEHRSEDGTLYSGMAQCPVCQADYQGTKLWEHMWAEHRAWMLESSKGIDFFKLISFAYSKRLYKVTMLPLVWLQLRLTGVETHIRQIEASVGHSTVERLHQITAPALVLTGTEDRVCPTQSSEVMAERIPNARLVTFEGGSHTIMIEMRSRFNREVVDFLSGG